jgi:hypothetical protein
LKTSNSLLVFPLLMLFTNKPTTWLIRIMLFSLCWCYSPTNHNHIVNPHLASRISLCWCYSPTNHNHTVNPHHAFFPFVGVIHQQTTITPSIRIMLFPLCWCYSPTNQNHIVNPHNASRIFPFVGVIHQQTKITSSIRIMLQEFKFVILTIIKSIR